MMPSRYTADISWVDARDMAERLGVRYDEHAISAFETNAIDYLLKPVQSSRLAKTLEKIRKTHPTSRSSDFHLRYAAVAPTDSPSRLAVRAGSRLVAVETGEILCILAQDHYSQIITKNREFLSDESLETLTSMLNQKKFVRTHRSAIVNVSEISELKREGDRKFLAILRSAPEREIPISRERLAAVRIALGIEI